MIERQRERKSLAGGPLVMAELPPPPSQQPNRETAPQRPAPAADAVQAASPSPSTLEMPAEGADTLAQGRMSIREWMLMRVQQMANLRGQVLYDAMWMSADEARRLHRRSCRGGLLISGELLVLMAAGVGCAWFVHQVLSALLA